MAIHVITNEALLDMVSGGEEIVDYEMFEGDGGGYGGGGGSVTGWVDDGMSCRPIPTQAPAPVAQPAPTPAPAVPQGTTQDSLCLNLNLPFLSVSACKNIDAPSSFQGCVQTPGIITVSACRTATPAK